MIIITTFTGVDLDEARRSRTETTIQIRYLSIMYISIIISSSLIDNLSATVVKTSNISH